MQSKLVNREEIRLVGLTVRTNNKNEMIPETAKIGNLVSQFWNQDISSQIKHRKKPGVTFSVYTEYENDEYGDYTYFIGEEVTTFDEASGLKQLTIPAATYQKFTTPKGNMPEVIINSWQAIWKMTAEELDGERTYVADFEVYDDRAMDPQNTQADIYIGIESKLT